MMKTVKERIVNIILLEKIKKDPKYAEQIGLSVIKKEEGKKNG